MMRSVPSIPEVSGLVQIQLLQLTLEPDVASIEVPLYGIMEACKHCKISSLANLKLFETLLPFSSASIRMLEGSLILYIPFAGKFNSFDDNYNQLLYV